MVDTNIGIFLKHKFSCFLFEGAPSIKQTNTATSLPRNKSDEAVGNGSENPEHKVRIANYS